MKPGVRCPICFRWVPVPEVDAHVRVAHPEAAPWPATHTTGGGGTVTDPNPTETR